MRSRLTADAFLVGALLIVTLGIALFAVRSSHDRQEEDEFPPKRTTYSPTAGGYRALFETLEALDYPVRRWIFSLDTLKDRGTVIVAAPLSPLSATEWQGLTDWVRQGNLLVYLVDYSSRGSPRGGLDALFTTPVQRSRPVQPTPVAGAAPDLRTRSAFSVDSPGGAAPTSRERDRRRFRQGIRSPLWATPMTPLYRDDRGTTVAYTRWGRGTVIFSSSPWSLSTAGVGQGDNFAWLLATLAAYAPDRQTPIWFDEYHHGYGQARGVLSLLAPVARLGLAQLAVAWLLLTYAVSRRFGGSVPDEGRVRRSRSEYLSGMASLLGRARAVDLAVGEVRRQFWNDATRALGLPREAELPALLAAATTRGLDPERLRSLLDRAERLTREQDRTHGDEALAIARELAGLRRELRH